MFVFELVQNLRYLPTIERLLDDMLKNHDRHFAEVGRLWLDFNICVFKKK